MSNIYILDIETLTEYFLVVAKHRDTGKYLIFEISSRRDDRKELYEFLLTKPSIITFNGLDYDYPILHHFMFMVLSDNLSTFELLNSLKIENDRIIKEQYPAIELKRRKLNVLDVAALNHYNSLSMHASLKYLEMNMFMDNVREMPVDIDIPVREEQMDNIIIYCKHDVDATEMLYNKSKGMIALRKTLTKKYKAPLINLSDSKMAKAILLKILSAHLKKPEWEVRRMRTTIPYIKLEEVIFPISFNSKAFNKVLDMFLSKTVNTAELKGALSYEVIYDGMKYNFGLGGLHAAREAGIYEESENKTLITSDIKSYYPNIAIVNNLAPAHLGKGFLKLYEGIYNERALYAKGTAENYGIKILVNSVYGLSNDENSFLYDPSYTLRTTLNGQLKLAKLCELLTEVGDKIIYANTDGIVVETEDLDRYYDICNKWEADNNGLILEHDLLEALWLRDTNGYIWKESNGSIKAKSAYELNADRRLHKDFSMNIIRKAVHAYFINNIPIDRTIKEETDIREFIINQRANKNDFFSLGLIEDGKMIYKPQGRYIRYIITPDTKDAAVLVKTFASGNEQIFHRGFSVKEVMHLDSLEAKDYKINYLFYIQEARKLITPILSNSYRGSWQKSMF